MLLKIFSYWNYDLAHLYEETFALGPDPGTIVDMLHEHVLQRQEDLGLSDLLPEVSLSMALLDLRQKITGHAGIPRASEMAL